MSTSELKTHLIEEIAQTGLNRKSAETENVEMEIEANANSLENANSSENGNFDIIAASESLRVSDSENEETVSPVRNRSKKVPKILDSDSEDESGNGIENMKANYEIARTSDLHSDTDSEDGDHEEKSKKVTKKKISKLIDSESEEEIMEDNRNVFEKEEISIKPKKVSSLIDSESEPDSESCDEASQIPNTEGVHETKTNERERNAVPKRASAKKALDEILAIRSETQRMTRENQVTVPYHKPKQHSLNEFWTRRAAARPQLKTDGAIGKNPRLRMNQEELQEFAKQLEERAKEATEFFKSEEDETNKEESDKKEDSAMHEELEIVNTDLPPDGTELREDIVMSESQEIPANTEAESPSLSVKPSVFDVDNLKRLIDMPCSPSLSGDPNMLIDLETGNLISPKPTGVDRLLQRFLTSSLKRKKAKATDSLSILSTENGKIEISKVEISRNDEAKLEKEPKPGAAYFKLKENLRTLISKKRKEDSKKKMEENKEDEEEARKCCGDFDDEEEEAAEIEREENERREIKSKKREICINDEEEIEEEVDEVEDEENLEGGEKDDIDYCNEQDNVEKSDNDSDADDEDEDEDDDDGDGDNDDDDDDEENNGAKPKNRIIKAFQDSDDEDDKTELNETISAKVVQDTSILFENEIEKNHSDVENELLDLCSGRFLETQENPNSSFISQIPQTQKADNPNSSFISQIPQTQMPDNPNEDELMDLCSGTFATEVEKANDCAVTTTQVEEQTKQNVRAILSSDEEQIAESKKTEKKLKKKKKKTKKLEFSDDEEEQDDEEEIVDEEGSDCNEEMPQTFIDYDSEENEIEVQMTKKETTKKANEYFENEAELSESEWGSADEDEKDLDRYDIELGDEDEFDSRKLRNELEQIHMRKMLDDDIREVKKIQDLLFEDEENDGVGRQRQFKWKNTENGFGLDNPAAGEDDANGPQDSGDEENEELWRKMRHERELALTGTKETTIVQNSILTETTTNLTTVIDTSSPIATIKKFTIISSSNKEANITDKKDSPFLISKATKNPARGSFLIRDSATLSKLASLTKSSVGDSNGTAGTVQVKTLKAKNFVFATLTEEEHANLKRKSAVLSGDEGIANKLKKPKVRNSERCLIDQLL